MTVFDSFFLLNRGHANQTVWKSEWNFWPLKNRSVYYKDLHRPQGKMFQKKVVENWTIILFPNFHNIKRTLGYQIHLKYY